MSVFWLAVIRKKAGAKRPRVVTTLMGRAIGQSGTTFLSSLSPDTLWVVSVEEGTMMAWVKKLSTGG